MKTMTARYFAQHASFIGKYLSQNPREVFLVTNKTNPKRNFICMGTDLFATIGYPNDVLAVLGANHKEVKERSKKSRAMSRKYWDGVNIKPNETGSKMEKVSTIVNRPKPGAAVRSIASGTANLETSGRKCKAVVHKVSTIRMGE